MADEARRARRGGLRQRRRRRLAPATTPRRSPPPRPPAASPCEVFVPTDAPMAKVEAARGQGAIVHVGGEQRRRVPGRRARARRDRRARVRAPVRRPGDRRRPGLARARTARGRARTSPRSSIPVGGGGLCAGVALAIKDAKPDVKIVGVQAAACAPFPESMQAGEPIEAEVGADDRRRHRGQAPRRDPARDPAHPPRRHGRRRRGRDRRGDGAAARALQARRRGRGSGRRRRAARRPGRAGTDGATVAVLSGGNVDAGLLAAIARRHETESGRRLVAAHPHPRPARAGSRRCWPPSPATGANIVDVSHVREGLDLHVRETAVELVLETRGHEHAQRVLAHAARGGLRGAGPALGKLRGKATATRAAKLRGMSSLASCSPPAWPRSSRRPWRTLTRSSTSTRATSGPPRRTARARSS